MANSTNPTTTAAFEDQVQGKSNSPIADRVTEAGHETVDRVAATMSKQEEKLRVNAEQAEEKIREMGAKAQETTEAQAAQVKSYIQKNPLASAGIAFAAGVVVSSLLRK